MDDEFIKEMNREPTNEELAQFIADSKKDGVSIGNPVNYPHTFQHAWMVWKYFKYHDKKKGIVKTKK